ncbi:MAG: HAMP domain-containing protein [Acidobacteria bacterium]|nr:HAMP domain-containing protein [Acidobacteriota bacterium]MBV9438108.1 HAMP domain-containing protein [Acidobacteriota bacterium]
MSLRTRLLLIYGSIVLITVSVISYSVYAGARRAFNLWTNQTVDLVTGQLRREFTLEGDDLARRAAVIASSQPVRVMATALSAPGGDPAPYLNLAATIAGEQQLDFVELLSDDGTIISSAHWPARFGLREPWIAEATDRRGQTPSLRYMETPDGDQLGRIVLREFTADSTSNRKFVLLIGRRIDSAFLRTFVLPEGTRLLLWQQQGSGTGSLQDASGPISFSSTLKPVIEQSRSTASEARARVRLDDSPGTVSVVNTIPLMGASSRLPLALLVVASSRRDLNYLQERLLRVGLIAAVAGIFVSILVSRWWAARISRPIEELSHAAQDVAAGNWERKVEVRDAPADGTTGDVAGRDEVTRLIGSFNRMTDELLRQRDRAVQAERVAAWRELARRLAHELKNPLFPLQITVENMMKARQQSSPEFDEIFRESTATLLAELNNLKKIIGRFSDFSKMPAPQLQTVDLNAMLREVTRLFAPQLNGPSSNVRVQTQFTDGDTRIAGDPDLLRRAFENLVLNAIDAMPQGGTLRIATSSVEHEVRVEISDTGIGLTEEETRRLFTPYYTTKQHGTGLGLAIVQSVISDHGARISVSSHPGQGTTFRLEFQRPSAEPALASRV